MSTNEWGVNMWPRLFDCAVASRFMGGECSPVGSRSVAAPLAASSVVMCVFVSGGISLGESPETPPSRPLRFWIESLQHFYDCLCIYWLFYFSFTFFLLLSNIT